MQPARASVDVGGTFTDLIVLSSDGLLALKVPSTPGAPERGVLEALDAAGARGAPLVHGSTVATNAILERKGARTALVATAGFADVIEIGRQERLHLYRFEASKPEPLVPRSLRIEADERVVPRGVVERPLSRAEAHRVAKAVAASGARSAAVCLLFSFERPDHEEMLAAELEKLGVKVSLSSRVLPEYREYERMSTTVMNAYVSPVMEDYLDRLQSALADESGKGELQLMHSAGGTFSARAGRVRAADQVLSGPAGGVVAASRLAEEIGVDRVLSFDMGGTSTDVSLIDGGVSITRDARVSGLPLALPMIDIHTIGAGGGSIARVDEAGVLKVGPESAGADPGPACYGRGTRPTVTDANLVLGRLEPQWFLGGRMELEASRSVRALGSLVGGAGAAAAARATLTVALSHMERALKAVSLERGHDPREFALVAFGGAGPMHACELASALEIPRVIVPTHPGLFSSMGMLFARPGRDYSRTALLELDADCVPALEKTFASLEESATRDMRAEGFSRGALGFMRSVEMRYRGQSHQVTVTLERLSLSELEAGLDRQHTREFGFSRAGQPAEVVNVTLACRAAAAAAEFPPAEGRGRGKPQPIGKKPVDFGRKVTAELHARSGMKPGHSVAGPALVLQDDTTTVIPPGWRARVDRLGNLEVER